MSFSRRKKLFVFGGGLLLIILIVYFSAVYPKKPEEPPATIWTSPFGIEIVGPPTSKYAESRSPLPPEKEKLKQELVAPLGEAGVLAETSTFRIDYFKPNIFQVEIKTTFIDSAKTEAIAWFKQKGFNEEDICNLPVSFYLSSAVVAEFQGSGLVFRPLPDFCK